jgi:hypothetical protein
VSVQTKRPRSGVPVRRTQDSFPCATAVSPKKRTFTSLRWLEMNSLGASRVSALRFTPNNGRWTAHPSQHCGCAFMSALVVREKRPAACFANVATMMGGRSTKSVTQGYLC